MPFIKVGSGDLTNYMYLREFALTNKPIIISTAMAINGGLLMLYHLFKM